MAPSGQLRRTIVMLALATAVSARLAMAEQWAGLGHELGCWDLSSVRKMLATDRNLPELANLGPFHTPDQLVAELRKRGMKPTTENTTFLGHRVVIVAVGSKIKVGFIEHRYCRDAPYRAR